MLTDDFNYNLPPSLIAQSPANPRDSSRLMIIDRKKQKLEHKIFRDIVDCLKSGDLIVWNNSKVFKARLFGKLESVDGLELFEHKKPVEIFLVRPMENEGVWKVLAKPGRHVKPGMRVKFASDFVCDVVVKEPDGTILVQFSYGEEEVRQKANKYGHVPVPPYVHPVKLSSLSFGQSDTAEGRFDRVKDDPSWVEQYQTVYAKHEGSVAAPTAGFHFTPELIQKLKNKGVEFAEVTLHVGLGTFLPVKSERVEDHTMHSEWVEVSQETADAVNRAKSQGRRVVAVGTTTVRTLEGVARFFPSPCRGGSGRGLRVTSGDSETPTQPPPTRGRGFLSQYTGDINLFIKPGFEFKVVDAMITNFHLPKSTLLMLVCAFAGDTRSMLQCYKEAVDRKYRFYSFGDAMFIL